MKRCPQCNRTYSEDSFSFCLADGALLSAPYNSEETLVLPNSYQLDKELEITKRDSQESSQNTGRAGGLYLEFWKGFAEFCRVQGTFLRLNKQSTRHWYAISLGRAGFAIALTASS